MYRAVSAMQVPRGRTARFCSGVPHGPRRSRQRLLIQNVEITQYGNTRWHIFAKETGKNERVSRIARMNPRWAVVVSWDAYTKRNVTFYLDSPMFALAWSPDDTRFVSSIYNFVQGPLTHSAPQEG